jgi:di/tricarboxylate transporter
MLIVDVRFLNSTLLFLSSSLDVASVIAGVAAARAAAASCSLNNVTPYGNQMAMIIYVTIY